MKTKTPTSSFARALKLARTALGVSQEDLDTVTSRTYISALERSVKSPTLPKVDQIAGALNIHPLSLLALSYCSGNSSSELSSLMRQVEDEARQMIAAARGG